MPFGFAEPSIFIPAPLQGVVIIVEWKNDPQLKKAFGIALLTAKSAFEAGCEVFGKETNKALFAAANWINDPIVIQSKENYLKEVQEPQALLDKTEFCRTLLTFSTEKIEYNGNLVYAAEAKDRLKALELYGKAQGFINEKTTEINNNNTFNRNVMTIEFVEAEKKETIKTVDAKVIDEDIDILENSPVKLQLVG